MRQIQLSSFATAVVLAVGVGTAAHAADRATPREARTMFEQAVRYMEENGAERAFAAFNDRQGNFVRKDLYVLTCSASFACCAARSSAVSSRA